ncbi:MAG TPA: hypothetical protein VGH16_09900 [Candidatus Binatia bacterium]|jgi:hypothetical protein
MEKTELAAERAQGARRTRFVIGVSLIAVSFTVYIAYFIIVLFLPFSGQTKAAAIVIASLLSWGGFALGIFLAGHEGYHFLRRICFRRPVEKE